MASAICDGKACSAHPLQIRDQGSVVIFGAAIPIRMACGASDAVVM